MTIVIDLGALLPVLLSTNMNQLIHKRRLTLYKRVKNKRIMLA